MDTNDNGNYELIQAQSIKWFGENSDKHYERAEKMEAKNLQDILIKILRSELTGGELDAAVKDQLGADAIAALFALSKHHDLAHMVSACLHKNGLLLDEEMRSKYSREEMASVYRYEQMRYAYGQICDALNEGDIPYIPLKGSVIRAYYPMERMRTSCDIDILVKEEHLNAAIDVLIQKGFQCGERGYHDILLHAPNGVHLELHFNIQEGIETLDNVLKAAWLYAAPQKGCCYAFTKEFFLFHMFAHMSYHFLSGGCGIRPLMDIWVMEHKMGMSYTEANNLLERAGIDQFAAEMRKLSEICFSDQPKDSFTDVLLAYVFDGGAYGTEQNKIAVKKEAAKSTMGYLLKRLFMPYKSMKILFPILEKVPVLLPFCWIIRIVKMICGGKMQASVTEVKTANEVSKNELETIKKMKAKLGL